MNFYFLSVLKLADRYGRVVQAARIHLQSQQMPAYNVVTDALHRKLEKLKKIIKNKFAQKLSL